VEWTPLKQTSASILALKMLENKKKTFVTVLLCYKNSNFDLQKSVGHNESLHSAKFPSSGGCESFLNATSAQNRPFNAING